MASQLELFDLYYMSFRRRRVYLDKGKRGGKFIYQIEYFIMLNGKALINIITGKPESIPDRAAATRRIRELNNGKIRGGAAAGVQSAQAKGWHFQK